MPTFEFSEYFNARRVNYCSISEDRVNSIVNEGLAEGLDLDDCIERVRDYIYDDPWNYIDEDETLDEDVNDRDFDFSDIETYIYDTFEEEEERPTEEDDDHKIYIGIE